METRDKTKINADAGNKSLEYPERKPQILSIWFVPALLQCALIIISLTVLWLIQKNIDTSKQNQIVNNVESTAESIRLRLKGNQEYLLMLASDRSEGALNSQSFQERASQYVADHPEMICINWVDATYTITDVAPIAPNKQIVGLRLKLPEPKRASRLAMKTRQPVYTHPFVVIQGDLAYELWVPVFHDGVFLGLFGGIYSYEKTLRFLLSPQIFKTYNVSLVDVSGKVLLEMPPTKSVDDKLVHRTPLILPENGALLQFKGYGPGVLERSLFLLEILCLSLASGIAYVMWRLRRENEASKKSQEALRNSYDYIQQLISSANVMIIGLDSAGTVKMFNKAAEKITGYTIKEVSGINWFEKIVPQNRYAYVWETFKNYQQKTGAMPITFENPILTKSGEERFISWQNSTISTPGAEISTISFGIDITEHKLAEEALRESEEKFAATFHASPNLIAITRMADGKIIDVNEGYTKLLGYSRDESIGKTTAELSIWTNPADRATLVGGLKIFGEIHDFETTLRRKDGTIVTVLDSAKVIELKGEKYFISVTHDITERKLAEAETIRAKEEWEQTFDATPDLIALIGVDHRIVRANRAMTERLGCTQEQAVGLLCWEVVHGLQAPPDFCPLSRMLDSGKEERSEVNEPRLGGVFDVSATPLYDKAGHLIGSVHVARDITERKRTEAALHFRNVLLSNQQEASIDGILVVDEDAHILLNNRRFVEMWNIPPELVEKKDDEPVLRFVTDKVADSRTFLQRVQYLYEHRRETGSDKINLKDGRTFDRYSAPMFGPDDQYYGRVWYFRDITEKLSMESQFRQAQKMESIGRLAGGVAHDFNNMLGVIIGHAEMVLNKMDQSEPFFNDLQEIRKAAEHSANLTRQLLAFARKQIIIPKVLDLNETVEGILKILRRLIGENIDLVWLPETAMLMVKMDPSQIDQILANLCVNARDAISGVGKVTIETHSVTFEEAFVNNHPGYIPGDFVLLSVSDNGCGMDKETLDKIFEPFFTTKELGKGTGLGLATVYGIVKQNNGFINVYSEQGQGTSFKIYLPRYVVKEGEMDKKSLIVQDARGYETILLVEDEPSILSITKQLLEELGYHVLPASAPDEAILTAKNHSGKIHLLLTDIVMPGMNGRDLENKLVSIDPGIKSLFMSGYFGVAVDDHDIIDKEVNFIQKPFSRHDLAAKVREVLDVK
ncbi:MAG TPA: PAS domain S-box protein [Desulfomonilia bacterium]